mgnify:FL=1
MKNMNTESETTELSVVDPSMSLVEAVSKRRSVLGFLDKEVPQQVINRIFEIAQQAPSNCNVQPWKAYVASGELKESLKKKMYENTTNRVSPNPDYSYTNNFENEYRTRQVECAVALYSKMGIGREDKEGRMRAVLRNFEFFDAPHIAFIGMDPSFGTTVAVDVGMWAQTLMLTMVAFGLHSCPMGTMRNYPDLVRQAFDVEDGTKILFGISFGYEDSALPANETRTTRDATSSNVVFQS